ncbi:MAG: hypothetical protein HC827_10555 [Cyanobacteria bacterium RM1_2_2]|nr:hypothetical protein [Cyanobacteria bacterium RM1_2_2]
MQFRGLRGQASGLGFGSLLLGLTLLGNGTATAQSLPACQPPRPEEYLLLVPNPQSETLPQLQRLLPENAVLTPCSYINTAVVRVEGFSSAEIASAWAQYLVDTANVQAYVARPASASSIASTPNAVGGTSSPVTTEGAATPDGPTPTGSNPVANPVSPAYAPQPLGAGYAVVVDYFNRPELAASVRQVTTRDVGLVAFEQQPYLLASYTTDPAVASSLLRTLSERGLAAAIVDSRRAVLLTPAVKLAP